MSKTPSNVIELRRPSSFPPEGSLRPEPGQDDADSQGEETLEQLAQRVDPAPFAEPTDVSAIFARLVEADGEVFIGVLAPPVEFAGWVLSPEQAMRLGQLLIERALHAAPQLK